MSFFPFCEANGDNRRNRRSKAILKQKANHETQHPDDISHFRRMSVICMLTQCLTLKGVRISGNLVAWGRFGDVYKGRCRGQKVALKVTRESKTKELLKVMGPVSLCLTCQLKMVVQNVLSEAAMWHQLSHPNVLPFYGICHIDENPLIPCLVCPWMDNGNVVRFLRERAPNADRILLVRLIRICYRIHS